MPYPATNAPAYAAWQPESVASAIACTAAAEGRRHDPIGHPILAENRLRHRLDLDAGYDPVDPGKASGVLHIRGPSSTNSLPPGIGLASTRQSGRRRRIISIASSSNNWPRSCGGRWIEDSSILISGISSTYSPRLIASSLNGVTYFETPNKAGSSLPPTSVDFRPSHSVREAGVNVVIMSILLHAPQCDAIGGLQKYRMGRNMRGGQRNSHDP